MMHVLMCVALLGQTPGKAEEEAPVVALFNGKDMEGWAQAVDNAAEWEVSGGVLEGRGGGRGQPAVLATERQDFRNYRLRVVFAFPRPGGGGLELRRDGGADATTCYWVSASVAPYPLSRERPAGHISRLRDYRYGTPLPPARAVAARAPGAGAWHTLDVIVSGHRVVTAVDGKPVDDYTDRRATVPAGGIALVCRGDSILRVKEILLQPLPDGGRHESWWNLCTQRDDRR
jgi:hypothetical protein